MSNRPDTAVSAIMDQAVAWHVRLNSGDADVCEFEAFAVWLTDAPSHRLAYNRLEELAERIEVARSEIAGNLRAESEIPALAANVVSFSRRRRPRFAILTSAAAAAVMLAAIAATSFFPLGQGNGGREAQYVTKPGETKTLTLTDGSTITLNVRTRLRVAETSNGRQVNLDSGEALFKVTHDPVRPLIVKVGDRDIHDVGTTFNVLRDNGQITVTVAEGEIALSAHGASSPENSTRVGPGEQFVHREGAVESAVRRVNVDGALAWPNGFLSYQNAPLSQVVEDLDRYFGGSIALQNRELGEMRFTGVLKMDDGDSVVERLTQFLPIASSRGPDGKIILRARPGGG